MPQYGYSIAGALSCTKQLKAEFSSLRYQWCCGFDTSSRRELVFALSGHGMGTSSNGRPLLINTQGIIKRAKVANGHAFNKSSDSGGIIGRHYSQSLLIVWSGHIMDQFPTQFAHGASQISMTTAFGTSP
jgi:hypothetical protein